MRKMKKTLTFVFVILIAGLYVHAEMKIGVIDPQKVVQNTTRGKEVMKKLENLGKAKQKTITDMRNEIKGLEKELLSPALNNEARQNKTVLLQDKQTKLKRLIEDSRRDFQVQYQKEMAKLRDQIMPVIAEIGKTQNFSIILDITTSGISYFDKTIDITELVIKAFNSKSGKK